MSAVAEVERRERNAFLLEATRERYLSAIQRCAARKAEIAAENRDVALLLTNLEELAATAAPA